MKQNSLYDSLIYNRQWVITVIFIVFFSLGEARAQIEKKPVNEDGFLYHTVPDILIDTGSNSIHLSDLWNTKPLLLTFVYAECKGICTPYLKSFDNAVSSLGGIGKDYQVVILSFDTTDNLKRMKLFCKMAGLSAVHPYILATTDSADLHRIMKATGFWYQKSDSTGQYDHPAEIAGINRGQVRRILTGAQVSAARLNEVVEELQGNYVRSYPLTSDNIWFRCFQVDPVTGKSQLSWGFLILFFPFLFTLLSTFAIFFIRKMKFNQS